MDKTEADRLIHETVVELCAALDSLTAALGRALPIIYRDSIAVTMELGHMPDSTIGLLPEEAMFHVCGMLMADKAALVQPLVNDNIPQGMCLILRKDDAVYTNRNNMDSKEDNALASPALCLPVKPL